MDWVETALLCVFGIAALVEFLSLWRGERPITGAARTDARMWLVWPWGWGLLASHFWSPWRSVEMAWLIAVGLGLGVLARDIQHRIDGTKHAPWAPLVALILGLASGLLWSRGY